MLIARFYNKKPEMIARCMSQARGNMRLLSKLYEKALASGDKAALNYLKHISPVASQHINISGLYKFTEAISNVNVDGVVDKFSKIWHQVINYLSNPITAVEVESELEEA